jgi:branched-chain amino acid transport system substrate-binding protein
MTGFGAYWGDLQAKAHIMATEQLNASGEFPFKIEVIVGDHKSDDPTAGLSAAQKMVDVDKVNWFNSSWVATTLAVNPLLQQNNIPEINAVGTGGGLLDQPGLYNLRLQANQTAPYIVKFVKDEYDIDSAAFIWWSDAHAIMGESSTKIANELGVDVTLAEAFEPNTKDFRSLIAKIKAGNPDAIFIWAFGEDLGYFAKQAREAGITAIIAANALEPPSYDVGGEALDGMIYGQSHWWPGLETKMNKEFVESYSKRWNIEPKDIDISPALEYEAVMGVMRPVLLYLLENCRDPFDKEELSKAILEIKTFPTILSDGTMEILPDGSTLKPLTMIRAGKTIDEFEILGEVDNPVPIK